jgi:pimeloyl-ACP methyl ester carboxylesterase
MMKYSYLLSAFAFLILVNTGFSQSDSLSFLGVYKSKDGNLISLSMLDLGPAGISDNKKRIGFLDFSTNDIRALSRRQGQTLEFGNKWLAFDSIESRIQLNEDKSLKYQSGNKTILFEKIDIYTEQEIVFSNDDISFYGTLSVPKNKKKKSPCVILLHGSGPGDRDYLYYHSLSQYLNLRGIAVFRFDKRGTGKSGGGTDFKTFFDLSKDIVAAVKTLEVRDDIDKNKIGVIGLSQGGWLGPLAASQYSGIKFVVTISMAMQTPEQQSLFIKENLMKQAGYTNTVDIELAKNYFTSMWDYYRTGENYESTQRTIDSVKVQKWYSVIKEGYPEKLPAPERLEDLRKIPIFWWLQNGALYNPIPVIQKLNIPTLSIYGVKDKVVDGFVSELRLRHYFRHPTLLAVKSFPNGNHQLFEANTGYRNENRQLKKLADGYYQTMADWILKINK